MTTFQTELLNWYKQNKRDLPWRNTTNPYKIWLSEIILQQTRVVQGIQYYYRFTKVFPDITSLAHASEDEVLKLWQGLGYYSRARNLHYSANEILKKFKGRFPGTFDEIRSLKGVGNYTAAAICSFAYNLPYAVVDGNVFRVLSRVFGIYTPIDSFKGKKEFETFAQNLLPESNINEYNQAIMEFGAIQCTPSQPNCVHCPLLETCHAFREKCISDLPVKAKLSKSTERFFNYLYFENKNKFIIQKRTKNDIWKNLYELPLIESDQLLSKVDLANNELLYSYINREYKFTINEDYMDFRHILTHQKIFARFFKIKIPDKYLNTENMIVVSKEELEKFAVSRLTELFFEKIFI